MATIKELEKANKELQDKLEASGKEIAELVNINQELQDKLETASKTSAPKHPTFKLDGKEYAITAPLFKFAGRDYKAKDAVKDKELLKALVKKEIGFITPVK